MNGYELSRSWFDFSFDNPEKIKPIHSAIYFFAIEHCNRLGWKKKFGFPSQMVMDAIGVKNWRTYSKALNELVDFGFIQIIESSKNQYSSNIIAIVKNTKAQSKAQSKALDKAMQKHSTKQGQSTVSIDKPIKPNNNKPINSKEMKTINDDYDLEDPDLVLVFDGVVKLNCYQFDTLLMTYSKEAIDRKVTSLSAGIHNKDKKYLGYKDHYRTLLNWLKNDTDALQVKSVNSGMFDRP